MRTPPAETARIPPAVEELTRLEAHVQSRLSGRVSHFRLLAHGRGLVLQGQTRTYFAKQLAQHAVMQASAVPIVANDIEVV
jgi:hypothetical protein